MPTLLRVKTTRVHPDPRNPRSELKGIDELSRSIEALGLLEPIRVRVLGDPSDELFMVTAGHRRLAAVEKLGLGDVDVLVDEDAGDQDAVTLDALATNTGRHGLSPEDLAGAVGQLDGLGWSDEELAAALGVGDGIVPKARQIAGLTQKARKSALGGFDRQLTLDEASTLARFADDVEDLADARATLETDPGYFPHLVAQIEQRREHAAKVTALVGSMGDVPRIAMWKDWKGPKAGTARLADLTHEGKRVTAANHRDCPGHAFAVEHEDSRYARNAPRAILVCTAWEKHGHTLKTPSASGPSRSAKPADTRSDAEKELASKQRKEVIANNRAWEPATSVRLGWLEEYLAADEPSARGTAFLFSELLLEGGRYDHLAGWAEAVGKNGLTRDGRRLIKGELDVDAEEIPTTLSTSRRGVLALSLVVTAREAELARCKWRPGEWAGARMGRYLAFLAAEGYILSEVEKLAGDQGAPKRGRRAR